uniref:Uncharacterized protein n=1 Tax=Ananas comosus var. bracteatus TaxID=296719 RepID=A0A6V7PMC8_ANACO|nr:unnamed protein product [Ananas comosus var. bracteatus]
MEEGTPDSDSDYNESSFEEEEETEEQTCKGNGKASETLRKKKVFDVCFEFFQIFWGVVDSIPTYGSHPENRDLKLSAKVSKEKDLGCSRVGFCRVVYRYNIDVLCSFAYVCEGRFLQAGTPELAFATAVRSCGIEKPTGPRRIDSFQCWMTGYQRQLGGTSRTTLVAFHPGRGSGSRERNRLELASEGFVDRHMAGLGTRRAGHRRVPGRDSWSLEGFGSCC